MELSFYHTKFFLFSMELDPSDTVLEMKQKIEKTKGIPVSKQTIFFEGKILLADRDSLTLTQCQIFNKSRLEFYFPRSQLKRRNISQALQQTQQSPAPASTSVKDVINIEDSPEKNQDSSNDDQVLHQLEKSLVPSWSFDEVFGNQEWPAATEGNVSVHEPWWRYDNPQDWLQRESSSSTSNIFEDSLFDEELFTNIQEDNNQMLQPTEQSLAQSTSVQASLGEYQDWSAVERSIFFQMLDQPEQSLAGSAMMARHDKNQDLFQSEPSSTSNTFGEDLPLPAELGSNIQSPWPASTTQEHWISDQYLFQSGPSSTSNTFGEDLPLPAELVSNIQSHWPASTTQEHRISDQYLFQSEPSSTSNTFGEDLPLPTELFSNIQSPWPASTTQEHRISDQYLPVSQVVQTQKPTRSIREVINIPDSPENSSYKRAKNLLTVMVLSFPISDTPAMKFPVEVNPSENVEVLRTELAKMQQRSQLLLPEGGYFFIHKTQILYEKQSFRWNRVAQGDTIEIFPGSVTDDQCTNTRG